MRVAPTPILRLLIYRYRLPQDLSLADGGQLSVDYLKLKTILGDIFEDL